MRLLIAGGGTGGHLFPGIAVAEELRARDPAAAVRFVGTRRGLEARLLPDRGWDLELISASGLKTVGTLGALRGLTRIPRALLQSQRILEAFRPDVVLGVGGYASGPVVLAARLSGVPCAILEPNSIPGIANRILGKLAGAVFLAFEHARRFFAAETVIMSGTPVRAEIAALASADPDLGAGRERGPAARGPRRLFVFGGSQGAVALNRLATAALRQLARRGVPFTVLHQTGAADQEATRAEYENAGIAADCRAFLGDKGEMAHAYQSADLVISRAGALSCAELALAGRPAFLVPYPFAADNHQEINAQELVRAGGAQMFRQAEVTPEQLADALAETLADPAILGRMGSAMKGLARPRAAAIIVKWCQEQLE